MKFSELGLSPKVLAAVEVAGYTDPTDIQTRAIPFALEGRDVLGIAQTGTGKTAAFTLPILTKLERGRARARMPRSLVLEPTRELAAQVAEALTIYGANHKMNVVLLIGGVSFADQDRKLDRGADIVIATPGRLLDHFERGKLMLNGVEILVVDEADRMLDMGFIPDIERIFKLTPFTRQTLFFSATMPPEIQRLTDDFLHTPERIEVARPSTTAATIQQRLVAAPSEAKAKREQFRALLGTLEIGNALIFCNRKRDVSTLHLSLARHGFNVGALHGDMDQHARMETLERFRSGSLKFLVASDVAARGLDIPLVSHVFNFDIPIHAEDYVHRVGRTGRAGRHGEAYSFATPNEAKAVKAIEALTGQTIAWTDAPPPAPEATAEAEADASKERRPRRSRSRTPAPTPDAAEKPSEPAPRSDHISFIPAAEETAQGVALAEADASADAPKERRPRRSRSRTPAQTPDTAEKPSEPAPRRDRVSFIPAAEETAEGVAFAETPHVPDFLLRPMPASLKS